MRVKEILQDASIWYPSEDSKSATPIVSVLLPTWARAKSGLFEQAVQSVLAQTIKELELIIVDDCSVDGTFELIKEFMRNDPRVSCIRHSYNIGLPAISEYEAYCKARGEWIAFIFDDNEWELDAIEKLLKCAKREKAKAVAGKYKLFNSKDQTQFDNPDLWSDFGGKKEGGIPAITLTNTMANGSVMLHRDVLEDVGLYDPHVTVTRLCDWDLWKRISQKYRFEITDELIGREKGFALGDSLGNSRTMDTWVACEQMWRDRDVLLRPDVFGDYEIFRTDEANSPFFCRYVANSAEQYLAKKWFIDKDIELQRASIRGKKHWEGKRIAYLCSNYLSASSELTWFRLRHKDSRYIIRPYLITSGSYNDWSLADAIVIVRRLGPLADPVLQWANSVEIPCYYYNDDNFDILKEEMQGTEEYELIKQLAEAQTPKALEQFSGIIVSTENLRKSYLKKQLKQRISVFPPLMPADNMMQPYHPPVGKTINIAFLGGNFRTDVLIKSDIPALIRISQEREICLHCPEETVASIKKAVRYKGRKKEEQLLRVNERFTVRSFPRSLSLFLCLSELKQRNISIQIHCGPSLRNNPYKTCNALINATTLGAVLIVTKDMPYTEIASSRALLMAENEVNAWEKALNQAMNVQWHRKIYQTAVEYCKVNHAPSVGEAALDQAFADNQSLQMDGLVDRMAKQMEWLRVQLYLKTVGIPAPSDSGNTSNAIADNLFRRANDLVVYSPKRRIQCVIEHIRKPSVSETLKKMNPEAYYESQLYIARPKAIPKFSDVIPYHGYFEYRLNGIGNLIQFFLIGKTGDSCVVEFVENGKIVLQMQTLVNGWGKVCIPLGAIRGEITVRLKVNDPNTVIRTFEYLDWIHAPGEISLFGWVS